MKMYVFYICFFLIEKKKLAKDVGNLNSCSFLPNFKKMDVSQWAAFVMVEMVYAVLCICVILLGHHWLYIFKNYSYIWELIHF